MIEIDVTVLISASLYLIYSCAHNTFFRFKKERLLVESAIYCHVLSWQCPLSSWHLPSRVGNSCFAVQSNRDLMCINVCFIPFTFTLPGPQWQSELDLTRSIHLVNHYCWEERTQRTGMTFQNQTNKKKRASTRKKKGFKVELNSGWVPREQLDFVLKIEAKKAWSTSTFSSSFVSVFPPTSKKRWRFSLAPFLLLTCS